MMRCLSVAETEFAPSGVRMSGLVVSWQRSWNVLVGSSMAAKRQRFGVDAVDAV